MKIKKQRYYNNKIAIDVFFNAETNISDIKKAAVIINGFPDFIGINPLTNLLVESNIIVFQPHMAGTFDSDYNFSPEGAYNTFLALNSFINDSIGSKFPNGELEKMPWKIENIVLAGHSFGGFFALRYFNLIKNINKIIFTSAVLHYHPKYGCLENGPEQYNKVFNQYPFTYRLSSIDLWNGMWEGKDPLPIKQLGKVNKIMVIYGENDKYFNKKLVNDNFLEVITSYINSDDIKMVIVDRAGHPLADLLDNRELCQQIKNFIFTER